MQNLGLTQSNYLLHITKKGISKFPVSLTCYEEISRFLIKARFLLNRNDCTVYCLFFNIFHILHMLNLFV